MRTPRLYARRDASRSAPEHPPESNTAKSTANDDVLTASSYGTDVRPQIRSPRIVARYGESTGRWVPISQRPD